jgi:predicted enzyme related to lactoylglutathione lyase
MPKFEDITFGTPCWMDLMTSDLAGAQAFYGELFGWTFRDNGEEYGHYTIASKGEEGVAGLMPKGPDDQATPDAWTVYLATEDARATAEAITANGGTLFMEPMEVGPMGTMAVAQDPSGAPFGIWQPGMHRGFTLYGEHGAPAWHELLTRDFAAATDFYGKAFNVEIGDMPGLGGESAQGPAYKTFNVNGDPKAGIMDASDGILPEGVPSNWIVYWGVTDADATVSKSQELGGQVMAPAADTPWGRFALLGDPTGAVFAVLGLR